MTAIRRALVDMLTSSSSQAFGPTLAACSRPVLCILFAFTAGAALGDDAGAQGIAAAGVLAIALVAGGTGVLYAAWRIAFAAAWRSLRGRAATLARPSGPQASTVSGPRLAA